MVKCIIISTLNIENPGEEPIDKDPKAIEWLTDEFDTLGEYMLSLSQYASAWKGYDAARLSLQRQEADRKLLIRCLKRCINVTCIS